jgi:hypothetical protein
MTDVMNSLLRKIDEYQGRVDDTASEFRQRIAALEAPEVRDQVINIGARAKLSTKARDAFRGYIRDAGNQRA